MDFNIICWYKGFYHQIKGLKAVEKYCTTLDNWQNGFYSGSPNVTSALFDLIEK